MASQTSPKGRVHLEGVTPHGEPDDSQGPCAPPPLGESRDSHPRYTLEHPILF